MANVHLKICLVRMRFKFRKSIRTLAKHLKESVIKNIGLIAFRDFSWCNKSDKSIALRFCRNFWPSKTGKSDWHIEHTVVCNRCKRIARKSNNRIRRSNRSNSLWCNCNTFFLKLFRLPSLSSLSFRAWSLFR